MFDLKQELQDYRPIHLTDIAANESDIPDQIRNSITLYNKAIESLHTGSEDIAIIELKKAVSLNPHFYEAMNLLGICYAYINEGAKASELFNKVIKAENNSIKALRYVNQLNGGAENESARSKGRKNAGKPGRMASSQSTQGAPAANSFAKRLNILRYAAGFVVGALLIGIISLSTSGGERQNDLPAGDSQTKPAQNTQQTDEYKGKYDEINEKYAQLQKDWEDASKRNDYLKSVIRLYEVEKLVSQRKFENAADILLLLKTVEFVDGDRQYFESLSRTVMPKAAWTAYDQGFKLYNTKKYEEALKRFDRVQFYDPGFPQLDAVLYYMGRSYQQLNDSRNATAMYQKLIDTYPASKYVRNAQDKIRRLTENP